MSLPTVTDTAILHVVKRHNIKFKQVDNLYYPPLIVYEFIIFMFY